MLEQIAVERQNLWRDGVRVLDAVTYDRIIREGEPIGSLVPPVPPLSEVMIGPSEDLIVPAAMIKAGSGNSGPGSYRKSKRAKAIGDWAEGWPFAIFGSAVGCSDCVHRAAVAEMPGWDIDYVDINGVLQRVEVKGTLAAALTGIDLTANEMSAAQTHGSNYWLYLVAGCLTATPKSKQYKTWEGN
jgi:Domain of unknown function (DUF3883)